MKDEDEDEAWGKWTPTGLPGTDQLTAQRRKADLVRKYPWQNLLLPTMPNTRRK